MLINFAYVNIKLLWPLVSVYVLRLSEEQIDLCELKVHFLETMYDNAQKSFHEVQQEFIVNVSLQNEKLQV